MKKIALIICAALVAIAPAGYASPNSDNEWVTLLGTSGGFENFTTVGEANWVVSEQGVEAQDKRQKYAFLVTKDVYEDFELHVEFWVSDDANSGLFLRCQDPQNPKASNCYEANIFDQRPDQTYASGSIVGVAPVPTPKPKTGNRWNTYDITVVGPRLILKLNGETTVDVEDTQFGQGPIGLQWGEGTVRIREVKIKPL